MITKFKRWVNTSPSLLAEVCWTIRHPLVASYYIKSDPRCVHLSHRRKIRCFRPKTYDGYCAHHNATCFHEDCG